ncbi:MAG: KilA-N domain-containing protein [Mangrovibacterium sp.]
MKVVKFIYNNQEVDFLPSVNEDVMVNATQMAKAFGKEMKDFNKLESTNKFIEACLISEDSSLIGIRKKEDLIISKKNSGTWMHRILALKFAAWLDPMFELWVFVTIDKILNHFAREQREAIRQKISLKAKKRRKKEELLAQYPELQEYFELEQQEKAVDNKRIQVIRQQVRQMEFEFMELEGGKA